MMVNVVANVVRVYVKINMEIVGNMNNMNMNIKNSNIYNNINNSNNNSNVNNNINFYSNKSSRLKQL